jgi:ATP-dependent Clp protease ATP-binding subunit ClpC
VETSTRSTCLEASVFERFTDRARRAVVIAQEEARRLRHTHIGTEHILLGLVREEDGTASGVLREAGLDLDGLRRDVTEIVAPGESRPSGGIPFSRRAKKVLELALREALTLRHNYIGTEHILLGLLREGQGVAAQVLAKTGLGLETFRARTLEAIRLHPAERSTPETALSSGHSVDERLDRLQRSLERIERRLDAMGAPPDPGRRPPQEDAG